MKIAFSVWPDLPGNEPLPDYLRERAEQRRQVLSSGGFDFIHIGDCDQDEIAKRMVERFYDLPTVRQATAISDYVRVVTLIQLLEKEKCDEVFYLDYDFHLWEPPSKHGITLESHISPDENGKPSKLWYRGQNSTYYLAQKHLPILRNHLRQLRLTIYTKAQNGRYRPKHTYPMNHLQEFENQVGFIPGYRHIASETQHGPTWHDTTVAALQLSVAMGDMPDTSIKGINWIGSHHTTAPAMQAEEQRINALRLELAQHANAPSSDTLRSFLASLKIRTNYNNLHRKRLLQRFIAG